MDEIRAKRLAKLGGAGQGPSPAPASASSEALPNPSPSPSPSPSPAPSPAPALAPTPSSPPPKAAPPADLTPPRQKAPAPEPASSPVAMEVDQAKPALKAAQENWENDLLQSVLRITLQPVTSGSSHLLYLDDLTQELKAENIPLILNADMIDRVIVARLSTSSDLRKNGNVESNHFEYLVGCHERALLEERKASGLKNAAQRIEVLKKIKEFSVNYAGLVIQMPDMFALEKTSSAPTVFADRLMNGSIAPEFLEDMVKHYQAEDLSAIFSGVLAAISNNMRNQSFTKNYFGPLQALNQLADFKPLSNLITSLPTWCPKKLTSREFEVVSFLGPFLRPSTSYFDDPVLGDQYFPNPTRVTLPEVEASLNSLRMTMHNYQTGLHKAVKSILVGGPEAREKTLQFIAEAIVKNEHRGKMQVDRMQVSTDGFIMNLVSVALRLSEPFVLAKADKIKLVDQEYPLRSPRFHIAKETRLRALSDEIDKWQKEHITEQASQSYAPNFITECFFLTSHLLHLGLVKSFATYTQFLKDIREMQKALKRLKEGPPGPQTEMFTQRIQQQLEVAIRAKFCYDVQLLDPDLLGTTFQFYSFVCDYMCLLADPEKQGLPLKKEAPLVFRALPEFIVEDLAEFFLFLSRFAPQLLHSNSRESLMNFLVMFQTQPEYIKSPHLRSKFIEILYMMTPEVQSQAGSMSTMSLESSFSMNQFVLNNLAKALMEFYQEVENTGSSHQFYEKFNVRYHISIVMKLIWENAVHREKIREESNNESFIRFVNLLLNDTTYLLDESLKMLTEIHNVQEKMKDQQAWNAMPENERKEIEQSHQMNERRCQSLLFLAKETLSMLGYLSLEVPQPFLKAQIIDRLVAMLNFNVAQLVGPKCQELKVQNPDKYGFNPKNLLSLIMEIYTHLFLPAFVDAMAKEGRSYSKALFDKACSILRKFALKPEEEITKIEALVKEVEDKKQKETEQEKELGEIPDEFLDPITYVTMSNPVLLPSSGVIVDRSTIETHLLSDQTDPFNRKPLSLSMVEPATELKLRIEKFLRGEK